MANELPETAAIEQAASPLEAAGYQAAPLPTESNPGVMVYDMSGKVPALGHIPHAQVQEAITSGHFSLPKGTVKVIDPEGKVGTIPAEHAREAFASGFKYATPELEDQARASTPAQQALTGVEGVAKGLAGPLATYAEKNIYGVLNPEQQGREMAARAKANPITAGVGEAAGLLGGALTGTGEAALLESAGQGAAKAAGLAAPTSYLGKVGSSAVKQAAEMAILQSGDEASKMVLNDPETSAQSALANVGLAASLGGAGGAFFTGAVSPLWKATVGGPLDGALSKLSGELGGVEGATVASDLANRAGINIAPELAAKIDGNPFAETAFSKLSQTDTSIAGRNLQKTLADARQEISNKFAETLGRSGEDFAAAPTYDKYTSGTAQGESLHSELKQIIDPVSKAFDAVDEKFKNTPLNPVLLKEIADKASALSLEEGWHKAETKAKVSFLNNILKQLPEQQTAKDLKNFVKNLSDSHPWGTETYDPARKVIRMFNEAREKAVVEGILAKGGNAAEAQEEVAQYNALRSQYRGIMGALDDLNEHVHVGSYEGAQSFLHALKDKINVNPEGILTGLSGSSKASVLGLLEKIAPRTLEEVRQHHIDKLLVKSIKDGALVPEKLMDAMRAKDMSPQVRNLIAGPAAQERLAALSQIVTKLHDVNRNWSNSGRTAAKVAEGAFTPLALVAAIMGHGGGAILAQLAKVGVHEGGDAARLGMMRFLGSSQPIKSEGFKSMVSMIHHSLRGENMLAKGAAAVFKPGAMVLSERQMPAKADRERLDKIVDKIQKDPQKLMEHQGESGHYLPDHQMQLTQAQMRAAQYLASIKPRSTPTSPLDRPLPPSPQQQANYERALDIAEQPMILLHKVKSGTLLPTDVQHMQQLYPAVFQRMCSKLTDEVADAQEKGQNVPYKTRMGLSIMLGQPMDSSMTPMAIQSAQPQAPQAPQQGAQKGGGKGHNSMKELGKSNKSYMTPEQASEAHKAAKD